MIYTFAVQEATSKSSVAESTCVFGPFSVRGGGVQMLESDISH